MSCKVQNCRFPHSHVTSGHRCGTCHKYGHGQLECSHSDKINFLKTNYGGEIMPKNKRCSIEGCLNFWSHSKSAHHCLHCNNREHGKYNCPHVESYWQVDCPICRKENKINTKQKIIFGSITDCCCCMTEKANVFLPECGHLCICRNCCKILDTSIKNSDTYESRIVNQSSLSEATISTTLDKFKSLEGPIFTINYAGMGCHWYVRRKDKDLPLEGFFMHSDSWGYHGSDDRPLISLFVEDYKRI